MKKLLSGSRSRAQQPSLDLSTPSYSQQQPLSPDPSRNPHPQFFRSDQPPQQQQQQQLQQQQQQQLQSREDPQSIVNRHLSQRRTSQGQQIDQLLLQQQQQQPPPQLQQPPQPPFPYQTQQGPLHPAIDERPPEFRQSYIASIQNHPLPPPPHEKEERKKVGFRERLGFTSSSKSDNLQPRGSGLNRHSSVRGKNSPNPERYQDDQRLYSAQNNSSFLGSTTEDESEEPQHKQFIVQGRAYGGRPIAGQKDLSPDQQFRQGQQDFFPSPGNQGIPVAGQPQFVQPGTEIFLTPEQHQHLQQLQQQGQFVTFTDQPQLQVQPQPYTHYPPPQGAIQPTGHPIGPPPGFTGQEQPRVSSEEAGQSPLPTPDPQAEILQPLATRSVAQAQQQEGLFLQAPSQGQVPTHSPPSPFPNQKQQDQASLTSAQPPSPTGTQQSTPSPMPPPSRAGASIRQAEGKPVPSREGSMAQGDSQRQYRGQGPPPQESDERAPPAERTASDLTDEDAAHYVQLQKDHKELREKYTKVKKYYFEKESQVHQLQNTLANQRMSASRTSLDDSEYIARFDRLSGLVSQLSFSIRKNWVKVPEWLNGSVNKDAITTAKQEMTAVGKAFISRWLWQEIFQTIFHPDLEYPLSLALKHIYANIRHMAPPVHSAEEDEALSAKLSSWRMATLDGVSGQLRSPIAAQNRNVLISRLSERLTADISQYLTDPAPSDVAGGVNMVVELAISIAAHLPIESREVCIEYYLPMSYVLQDMMKIETAIPPLSNPIVPAEGASPSDSTGTDGQDGERDSEEHQAPPAPPKDDPATKSSRRGMLSSLMGGGASTTSNPRPGGGSLSGPKDGPKGPNGAGGRETPTPPAGQNTNQSTKEERVRMATGLAVMIRGRSVLVKAPVYTAIL